MCSITTITLLPEPTKSIAPPIPFTIFPGIIQLAMSPVFETYNAPRIVKSKCLPLTIANDAELENADPPGIKVVISFPALIISGSSYPFLG